MIHVEVSDSIDVPREKLFSLMSDYNNWPKLFPSSHTSVKLVRREGNLEYLELCDKRYGKVTEIQKVILPDKIVIEEFTPSWVGTFVNLFEVSRTGGTQLTLKVDITGRNFIFELIGPFSESYIRNRIWTEMHEQLKKTARLVLSQPD